MNKSNGKILNITYMHQLFAVYCAVIIFFVIVLSVIFTYGYTKINVAEYNNEQKITFINEYKKIENKFNIALNAAYLTTLENTVKDYSQENERTTGENYYKTSKIMELLSEKNAIFAFSNMSVSVSDGNCTTVIHSNKTEPQNLFLQQYGFDREQLLSDMADKNLTGNYYSVFSGENNDVLIVNKNVYKNGHIIFIYITLDFSDIFEFSKDNIFSVINGEDVMCQNAKDNKTDIGIIRAINKDFVNDNSGECKYKDTSALYKHSESLGNIMYIMTLNDKKKAGNVFVLYTVILIVIAVLLSFFLAKNMYKPIEGILNLFDGYFKHGEKNDIEFIKETTKNVLVSYKSSEKNNFIFELLNGWYDKSNLMDNINKYEMLFLCNGCICFVLEYIDVNSCKKSEVKSGFEYFSQRIYDEICAESCEFGFNKCCYITDFTETDKLKKILMSVLTDMDPSTADGFRIGIGSVADSPEEISSSYLDGLNALEIMPSKEVIVNSADTTLLSSELFIYPLEIEKNLIESVVSGAREKTYTILGEIIKRNASISLPPERYMFEFKFAMVSTIKRILNQIGKRQEEIFGENTIVYLEVNAATNAEELKMVIYGLFEQILDITEGMSKMHSRRMIDDIKEYIYKNYARDISLTDVACKVNLTPNYVGKIIKNDLGDNFRDYINKIRINKAKEILNDNPDIKIDTLIKSVGFNSAATFIRIFKKYEGISPKQYTKV